jgi:hypothetical protein
MRFRTATIALLARWRNVMSFIFLVVLLGAGLFHGLKLKLRSRSAVAEMMLVYVLVGYCGLYMVMAGIFDLWASFQNRTIFPFPASGATQQFFDFALLGMATMAIFSAWFRGRYLASPAVGWSLFWFGATYIHFTSLYATGSLSWWTAAGIFSSHTLVAFAILGLLFASKTAIARVKI